MSLTFNQPSEFFQNKVVYQLCHVSLVRSVQPRQDTDAMIDGSIATWCFPNKIGVAVSGLSVDIIY
jgi:hypothetical protein